MKLVDVLSGTVYVDTNVLYMYLRSDSETTAAVKTLLERVVLGKVLAVVSIPTVDELFYRLLLAQVKTTTGRNPLDVLRENQLEILVCCQEMLYTWRLCNV